jgi:hypothetical protein
MEHINKDVTLDELNMLSKVDNFIFLQKDVNNQIFKDIKYIVIRKIPLIFLMLLIITLVLIFYTSVSKYDDNSKYNIDIADKLCYLFMGLTVVVANVYLLSLRTEYKYKMNTMFKYKKEIDDYNTIKINEALYNQKNNI